MKTLPVANAHGRPVLTYRRFARAGLLTSLAWLSACGPLRVIDVPAEVHTERVDHLVLHFTGENFARSLQLLSERTQTPVSVHYLVPEGGDDSYPRRRLRIHRLVPEHRRAWHAGNSYWRGVTALNARSIGIEIVNRSRCDVDELPDDSLVRRADACTFRSFDEQQIELVIELSRDILARNPGIDPEDVVAHADIAPNRRADPGPLFPWRRLYEHGIGAWFDDSSRDQWLFRFADTPPAVATVQRALRARGYDVAVTGTEDTATWHAVQAFQMHFRPSDFSGEPDAETVAILFALIEKYRPRLLAALLTDGEGNQTSSSG